MDNGPSVEELNRHLPGTLMETLDIRFTGVTEDALEASMPVDSRHLQPMGILHGGATAALAESVGSMAAAIQLEGSGRYPVGLDLSINHIKSRRSGSLNARAGAIHLGRSTQLWEIRVTDEESTLVAVARLTVMILSPAEPG